MPDPTTRAASVARVVGVPGAPAAARRPGAGLLDALALGADTADDLLLGTVRDVHAAVSGRVSRLVGRVAGRRAGRVAQLPGAVAAGVYAVLGTGLRAGGGALREADRRGYGSRVDEGPRGRRVLAAVNGLVGDRMDPRSELTIRLAVRVAGRDVDPGRAGLGAAFPDATGDLVVFLHGLAEHEDHWDRAARQAAHEPAEQPVREPGGGYGGRLAAETCWTPVYLRANTGLPVAENGRALAALLDRLVAGWPSEVRRVALVGHSMGGLVLRAACAADPDGEDAWRHLVTDVVTLGTPHVGAPLERAAALGARALGLTPESAPFGRLLAYRSAGILDLGSGLPPDVRNLPQARYHLVAATVAASHRHPVSEVLGDLLVRYPSATGRLRAGEELFPGADVLHVKGDHFDLLDHPEVHAALRRWLS